MTKVVYLTPALHTVSGGTRKLADHVAILYNNDIDAQLANVCPPTRINPKPGSLFVFPEVSGEWLIDALPEGTPRISMVQNGYLLDYGPKSSEHSSHPYERCKDLRAILVESEHTEEIVRKRFPDIQVPIIRFHSSGNGLDGKSKGLFAGPWPRAKQIGYFQYKRQEITEKLFAGMSLPGWRLKAIGGNVTDAEVAQHLRESAIFCAPITHEGLCATTQEAVLAGSIVVGWPGGPSRYIPTGWPNTIPVEETEGNITVGGPMEYLNDKWSVIVSQDDIESLRAALVETAQSIDEDFEPWEAKSQRAARFMSENYGRKAEIEEIVGIFQALIA